MGQHLKFYLLSFSLDLLKKKFNSFATPVSNKFLLQTVTFRGRLTLMNLFSYSQLILLLLLMIFFRSCSSKRSSFLQIFFQILDLFSNLVQNFVLYFQVSFCVICKLFWSRAFFFSDIFYRDLLTFRKISDAFRDPMTVKVFGVYPYLYFWKYFFVD